MDDIRKWAIDTALCWAVAQPEMPPIERIEEVAYRLRNFMESGDFGIEKKVSKPTWPFAPLGTSLSMTVKGRDWSAA